ncbi:MAG TPA: FAD:protein FMN transferase [Woeseiaceae bacterium]|nr:FAD:protein FMN transferase [Woeseiaceae bacterium]
MRAGDPRKPQLRRAAGYYQGQFQAMGSPCEVLVDTNHEKLARKLLQTVAAEAWRIEDKFSRYRTGNIVSTINESDGKSVAVDDETANLLDYAATLYELSEHRFDVTSGVLRKIWVFDGSDRVPSAESVRQIMDSIGWHRVSWQRPRIRLQRGMQIDLGGIGKEYAVDRAAARISPLATCPCLINFGGDLVATGDVRQPDGWQVGIEAPDQAGAAQKLIALRTGALATSGDSRRFLLKDGVRYSHILNPLTGWPIEGAPDSVTVAADSCTQAGTLTTLAMLNGPEAEAFLQSQNVQYWCLRATRTVP